LFDRYRAMASIDFGDWDSVERCLEDDTIDRVEIRGLRDVILAPVSEDGIPHWDAPHQRIYFEVMNCQLGNFVGGYKRWAREIQTFRPTHLWSRGDMPMGRHVRYRQLHDAFATAIAEALGGRLPVAIALASEARHLGDPGEPLRVVAADLEHLAGGAMGDAVPEAIGIWQLIPRPTGSSPLGTWQWANYLLPLVAAVRHPWLEWGVELFEHTAIGLGSPRAHLQAETWKVALKIVPGGPAPRELRALLVEAQRAGAGLRVLPLLLKGIVTQQVGDLAAAERAARRVQNVWAQVSALIHLAAVSPTLRVARDLDRLLSITGWRRPVLAPSDVVADAALGMASVGIRSRAVIDLAAVAGRPNVTMDVARRHLDESRVPLDLKLHALDAIAVLPASHAQELIRAISTSGDGLASHAASLLARPSRPFGLSERELEVMRHAGDGLSNREIAARLVLSPHTVAHHLANARTKLGAANRTEAATKLQALAGRPE
jgi:DNA-binding CsgD family transcriptional regulator